MLKLRYNGQARLLVCILIICTFILIGAPLNPFDVPDQFERRVNPPSMINPDSVAIAELNQEFEGFVQTHLPPSKLHLTPSRTPESKAFRDPDITELKNIEYFLVTRIGYRSDILQYQALDYLATDIEVIQTGSDDCDGLAILATSLLLHRGYDAWVLISPSHTWVEILLDSGQVRLFFEELESPPSGWYFKFNRSQTIYNWPWILGKLLVYSYLAVIFLGLMLPIVNNDILSGRNLVLTGYLGAIVTFYNLVVGTHLAITLLVLMFTIRNRDVLLYRRTFIAIAYLGGIVILLKLIVGSYLAVTFFALILPTLNRNLLNRRDSVLMGYLGVMVILLLVVG